MTKNLPVAPFLSTTQLARLLGVSRIAVFQKIKEGKIKAHKIGRNYVIPGEEFASIIGEFVSPERKKEIEVVVKRAVHEYRGTLELLGKE